jgi:uncharacterized protein YndB with AHSA1/START domain
MRSFTKTITITATPPVIWDALTNPGQMKTWMAETDLDIITSWQVGSPITILGETYQAYFENKGRVLQYQPEQLLQYSHLSSLSRLPDTPENYTLLEFRLIPEQGRTQLTLTITNFPTESIYRHFAFYWNVSLEILKKQVETAHQL